MRRAVVTGSGGLVGSETVAYLVQAGFDVIGIENDMRSYFFGPEASTRPQTERLLEAYGSAFRRSRFATKMPSTRSSPRTEPGSN